MRQPATSGGSDAASPGRPRLGWALALMVMAQFVVILDFSIVNVALPSIQAGLGFSALGVEGVITAYATAFGGVLILGGRLADLYGRRRVFLAGLVGFAATSLACALAGSPAVIVVARVTQGLSAALLAPAALALLTTTFPEGPARNRALGVFGAATAAGFVAGQVLGGVLTELAGWRSIFIINVPVTLAAAALVTRLIAPDGPRVAGRRPDVAGAVLISAAMALAVWAPARGADRGWGSAAFLVPVAAAVVLLAVFAAVEAGVRDPLLRLSLLRSRWLAATNAVAAITGALNGVAVLVTTLYLQHVRGYTPLAAGLAFVPTGLAGLLMGTRFAGPLVTRFGVRGVLSGAGAVSAVALAGLSRLDANGGYERVLPWLIVIGASFTTAAVATTVAVSTGVAGSEQGTAAALRQTAFQLGVATGVAVLVSIAVSHTSALLSGPHPPGRAAALTAGYREALLLLSAVALAGAVLAALALRAPSARSACAVEAT